MYIYIYTYRGEGHHPCVYGLGIQVCGAAFRGLSKGLLVFGSGFTGWGSGVRGLGLGLVVRLIRERGEGGLASRLSWRGV